MKEIKAGSGRAAFVDDSDFDLVNSHNWQSHSHRRTFVVHRKRKMTDPQDLPKKIYLHRFILNAKKGQIIDHKDGNSLNNQKSNLRFCTNAENARNSRSRIGATSRFLGVSKHRTNRAKWVAQYQEYGKSYHIGIYESEVEAALAYNVAASFAFREFARLNVV